MNPKSAIQRLVNDGLSQTEIATAAKTTQPTISRILAGKPTSYEIGARLIQLASSLRTGKKAA